MQVVFQNRSSDKPVLHNTLPADTMAHETGCFSGPDICIVTETTAINRRNAGKLQIESIECIKHMPQSIRSAVQINYEDIQRLDLCLDLAALRLYLSGLAYFGFQSSPAGQILIGRSFALSKSQSRSCFHV